jgi:probable HAF family extracellular repeat protein
MRRMLLSVVFAVLVIGVAAVAVAVFLAGGSSGPAWAITDLGFDVDAGGFEHWSGTVALNERGQVVGSVRYPPRWSLWQNGKVRDLGAPPGDFDESAVVAINNRGQIIGYANKSEEVDGQVLLMRRRAFVWENGRFTDLGGFGGDFVIATAINNRGQIVGTSETSTHQMHAFLWQNGRLRDIGGSCRDSQADAVNDRGQVVGSCTLSTGRSHAFLWEKGKMRDLGALPGSDSGGGGSQAWAVNSRGQVVGDSSFATRVRAFLWSDGRMRDIGTLGGDNSGSVAINDRGQVIGWSDKGYSTGHTFLWENGTMRDLGVLALGESAYRGAKPAALNDEGQVVGQSSGARTEEHAFVWENGNLTDLGTLPGGSLSAATAINNDGQIAGWSDGGTSTSFHAVLWTLSSG